MNRQNPSNGLVNVSVTGRYGTLQNVTERVCNRQTTHVIAAPGGFA